MCLILTSYRDGEGKVRQRRLGHFRDRQTLDRAWSQLSEAGLKESLDPLRPRAEQLLSELQHQEPQLRAQRASRTLLAVLSDYPELSELAELKKLALRLQAEPESAPDEASLQRKVEWEAVRLHPRRRKHWAGEASLASFVKSREKLATHLSRRGESGLEQLRLAAEQLPESLASLDYAAQLQSLGELDQAKQILGKLPREQSWRNFNLAACAWSMEQPSEALNYLLAALARDEWVWRALEGQLRGRYDGLGEPYWERYGRLWDEAGRRFFLTVARLPGVRFNRSKAQREGRKPRKLMPDFSHQWILKRALEAASDPLSIQARPFS